MLFLPKIDSMRRGCSILFLIIFTFSFTGINAQRLKNRGDEAYEREQFKVAIDYYAKEFDRSNKSRKTRAYVSFMMGEAYMKLSEPEKAISHYKKAIDYHYEDITYLRLAYAYLMHEEFDNSISTYETYLKQHQGDMRAEKGILRVHRTLELIENPGPYQVKLMAVFNSGELDYCPFFGYKDYDKVFFTSSRSVIDNPDINLESGEMFTDIYVTERNRDGEWSVPEKIYGGVNSEYDEGAASLNRRYNVLYFSRCALHKDADRGCRIYKAKRRGHYWSNPELVKIPGIPDQISIGHPSISEDECTLYFVADSLLGGYGGKDIYKVTRERKSKNFQPPQNLGPDINTVNDDCFPYYRDDGILFFASDGHMGMGGLDLYKAEELSSDAYDVTHLKSPINSPQDDYGIVFKSGEEEGHFTSRRRGGIGKSDIYHFSMPETYYAISGKVFDKMENKTVGKVKVQLLNNNQIIDTCITNTDGTYRFELEPEQKYKLVFTHNAYLPKEKIINTDEENRQKTFKEDIFLDSL